MAWEGGCLCRAVRYRIDAEPGRVTHCHCLHCRGTSGAPFLTWVECRSADFSFVAGEPASFSSRPLVTRRFCGRCGTQLTYQHAEEPHIVDVTACSLDRPETLAPQDHIWADRMLPWVRLADGLRRYALERIDP